MKNMFRFSPNFSNIPVRKKCKFKKTNKIFFIIFSLFDAMHFYLIYSGFVFISQSTLACRLHTQPHNQICISRLRHSANPFLCVLVLVIAPSSVWPDVKLQVWDWPLWHLDHSFIRHSSHFAFRFLPNRTDYFAWLGSVFLSLITSPKLMRSGNENKQTNFPNVCSSNRLPLLCFGHLDWSIRSTTFQFLCRPFSFLFCCLSF